MKIMQVPVVVPPMGGIVPPWLSDDNMPHILGAESRLADDDWDDPHPNAPDPRRGSDG